MTKNFQRSEFACRCGCGFDRIHAGLVDALQLLRDALGRPVIVLSGCRCEVHNRAVGGARASMHVSGRAADIRVAGLSARELYRAVAVVPAFRGVGVSDAGGFVHVDVRARPARWCYRGGRQVPWFDL